MSRSHTGPRPGRAVHWVLGICFLALAGIIGYRWYMSLDHHEQNDALLAEAKDDKLSLVSSQFDTAEEWPQWLGPNRDGISTDDGILTEWPSGGLKELWRVPMGTGLSSMAVAGGRLFTLAKKGDQDAVVCLDAKTGKEQWSYPYGPHFSHKDGAGARSTPTVEEDRVYAVGAQGELVCLNAKTGKRIWGRTLNARIPTWGLAFSPLIEGDMLLTLPAGGNGESVVAFDKMTGEVKWKSLSDGPSYSSPIMTEAAGKRQVLCFMADALVGVDPKDGTELWRYEWDTKHSCNIATPVVRGDYVFISSNYGKGCATLKIMKKDDGTLAAEQLFKSRRMKNHQDTCIFHDEHLYGFNEGYFACIEMKEGTENPDQAGERRWSTREVRKGCQIAAEGHLIVYTEDGQVVLVKPSPEGYEEKARFRATKAEGRQCWALPVLAYGKLYVRTDENELICYDIRKGGRSSR